jgi:hypothetical protein
MANYSKKFRSPQPLLLFAAGLVVVYFLPSETWGGYAVAGVIAGIASSALFRNAVLRTFDPPDAPAKEKQQAAVGMALFQMLFGAFILLIGVSALAHWLAPTFEYAGGFLIGRTAITPVREKDFA